MRLTDLVTPLKPLEAMAQGRILAASDVGGHLELIADGKTGVLFRANDTDSLVDKVATLLESQQTWPGLREAGRDYVETERNWPVSVARYKNIYSKLTGSQAA
jgi:glycosyltransferase involved in cell wall biosynthesis